MMFKPEKTSVMVELVEKKDENIIHLPDSVKGNHMLHDLVVFAVGDDVELYVEGDRVLTPLPSQTQLAKIPVDGEDRTFIFWDEKDIFGKFID